MATATTKQKTTRSLTITDADTATRKKKAKANKTKRRAVKTTARSKQPSKRAPAKQKLPTQTRQKPAVTSKTKRTNPTKKSAQKTGGTTLKREPLGHLLAESLLRESGFRGGVSSNAEILDRYSYDESIFSVRPQIVIQPTSQRDVEIAVTVLSRETKRFPSLSLTPRAAGTGLSGGSLTDSVVIDVCAHLNQIEAPMVKSKQTTITCQPGAMWRDVEAILQKIGVYIPSYPASKDICSIGGAIGNNAAGPDSLRFGHCADWVDSLEVVLADGHAYTIKPLSYREYKTLIKKDTEHARIAHEVFSLIEKNEKTIDDARPATKKNSAGYALWDVLDTSVAAFKRGKGTFDLTRLLTGSQGTIGIITNITLRTEPIKTNTSLLVVPVFDLMEAGAVIERALTFDPINIELFDGLTFDLALQNPSFFKNRLTGVDYYKVLLKLYTTYHVRYRRRTPEFTLLITLDAEHDTEAAAQTLRQHHGKFARLVSNPIEVEMFWQVRRASYTLSKFQDKQKRPAAFLEDMAVPPKNLSKFFTEIKKLLKKYNITAAVHGHGGNGHLHFYPLLDFTQKNTAQLVERMSDDFFATAIKHKGNICGEHNDGIIRTPHLSKQFNKKTLQLFTTVENIFDPEDIFNPGKKVNPRFDIKDTLRTIN